MDKVLFKLIIFFLNKELLQLVLFRNLLLLLEALNVSLVKDKTQFLIFPYSNVLDVPTNNKSIATNTNVYDIFKLLFKSWILYL